MGMGFRFISQPFPGAEQVGALLRDALRDGAHDSAWFATAWGKRSGLSRLVSAIEALKARGGRAEAILGVDEDGATIEGLELALALFDAAFVFHDPGERTFHPKLYVVQGAARARAIVGSGNLTAGGLFTNFEAGVAADLDLAADDDARFLASVRTFYDQLRGVHGCCLPLTEQLIADLQADPRIGVGSEKRGSRARPRGRARGPSSVFGAAAIAGLLQAPAPDAHGATAGHDDDAPDPIPVERPDAAPEPADSVVRWWKRMSDSDAYRKQTGNPRNSVVLGQGRQRVDTKVWFREEFFGDHVTWAAQTMSSGNVKEETIVPFDVWIAGRHRGVHNLKVDHAENRIAHQNNPPTYLNWSSLLPEIKAGDYRKWWLELARLDIGRFKLMITRDEPSAD